jgi:redox-sensing transcriptional repressor
MTKHNDSEWHANGHATTERSATIQGGTNGAVGRMSGTFIDSSLRAPALSQLDDEQQIPDIVIRRLPIYVRTLRKLNASGITSVSSEELAERIGVTAAQIRRDLSYFGKFGKQGKGYDTDFLARAIGSILRLDRQWPVALVGLGNLGRAIAGYRGFTPSSFTIVALFDRNPQNVGMVVNDLEIQSEDHLTEVIARERIKIGIIASPSVFAQDVADRMVEGGIEAILNYAPVILKVPENVTVREIDPVSALQSMTYYLSNRVSAV